jgi:hypothetical protein
MAGFIILLSQISIPHVDHPLAEHGSVVMVGLLFIREAGEAAEIAVGAGEWVSGEGGSRASWY